MRTKRWRITDKTGMELGEAEGATKPQALLSLYRLAQFGGVTLTKDGRRLAFEGARELNVSDVHFERLA